MKPLEYKTRHAKIPCNNCSRPFSPKGRFNKRCNICSKALSKQGHLPTMHKPARKPTAKELTSGDQNDNY